MKQNKNFKAGEFHLFSVDVEDQLLSNNLIQLHLNSFWESIMSKLNEDHYVLVNLKVFFSDKKWSSIGPLQKVNKNDKSKLCDLLCSFLDLKKENYKNDILIKMGFQYLIIPEGKDLIKKSKLVNHHKQATVESFKFSGYDLPYTADYLLWGRILFTDGNLIVISRPNSNLKYKIEKFNNYNKISILNLNQNILSFTDKFEDRNNLSTFTRIIDNHEYIFTNGNLIVKKIIRKSNYLTSIQSDKKIHNKFLTLDIETQTIKDVISPVLISIYDGKQIFNYYLTDYVNVDTMFRDALINLCDKKYHGHIIYVHNLSYFDGIFLLKRLSKLGNTKLEPILKEGKMIQLKLKFDKHYIILSAGGRDSMLLLPLSLRKLAIAFNVTLKSVFPYWILVNRNIPLDYVGMVPHYESNDQINREEYNIYASKFKSYNWNLRRELTNYCENDCVVLFQVIQKFNEFIFDLFQLNIHRFPTLPSLAFGIFRCHFLKDFKIPLIVGQMFHAIRSSYTGGATDVYIPGPFKSDNVNEQIHSYDVNSLYPFNMAEKSMPVGKITYFDGDISKIETNPFGFFYCKITSPKYLEHPILQTKIKTEHGLRTIAPLGEWYGFIFSQEMNNAIKYGYKFEILNGYTFEKQIIFKEYVELLYKIKQNNTKNSPLYLISKLLMNSLYGKFGMFEVLCKHSIVSMNEFYDLNNNNDINIEEIIELDEDTVLVSFIDLNKFNDHILNSHKANINISIAISSAIAAEARICMTQFKNNPNVKLAYTDTDSVFVIGPLSEHLIGPELGKLKLEFVFKESVFIAPKVYGGILENNSQIVKVKGLSNIPHISYLFDSLEQGVVSTLYHEKWYKDIQAGAINIKYEQYSLAPTENKRKLIYQDGKFIKTVPFIINTNKEIINK
jgi:hypothetical protein